MLAEVLWHKNKISLRSVGKNNLTWLFLYNRSNHWSIRRLTSVLNHCWWNSINLISFAREWNIDSAHKWRKRIRKHTNFTSPITNYIMPVYKPCLDLTIHKTFLNSRHVYACRSCTKITDANTRHKQIWWTKICGPILLINL